MDKEKLYNKNIGDMNKEELYEFCQLLLDEIWGFEDKIDKAIKYIQKNNRLTINRNYLLNLLLGGKENE